MAEPIAQFRFTQYSIKKSFIEIKDSQPISDKLDVEIKQTPDSSLVNIGENKFSYTLEVDIKDENNVLAINVIIVGFFEFDSQIDNTIKENFFNINAPAILFPYIRAHITTLTSLSGIKPVILPTINLSARKK